jgi:cytochrome c-type biogenesis protein
MSTNSAEVSQEPAGRPVPNRRLWITAAILVVATGLITILSLNGGSDAEIATGGANMLVLTIGAFAAGILSFLSPCTLPILPAYFAFTFQARRASIVVMSVAFCLGLATTMTLLGASATALSGLIFNNREVLTFWGGMIVIGFGVMGLLGMGFAGPQIQERPVATFAGSYLFGATFALGWTACIGPILATMFTLLITTSNVAIAQGAVLSFIYALGLGLPLVVLATFFNRLGNGSRFWRFLKGRGFEINLGGRNFHLHTTNILSGLLMISMGVLLASGQLSTISQLGSNSAFAEFWVELEIQVSRFFGLY